MGQRPARGCAPTVSVKSAHSWLRASLQSSFRSVLTSTADHHLSTTCVAPRDLLSRSRAPILRCYKPNCYPVCSSIHLFLCRLLEILTPRTFEPDHDSVLAGRR